LVEHCPGDKNPCVCGGPVARNRNTGRSTRWSTLRRW
jgi:hypothetical protein